MSTRRRRVERTAPQGREQDRPAPSRTGALRKTRQERQTRTTIVVAAIALLCVPLALWIYPKITSGAVLSRLAGAQLEVRSTTATQILGVSRSAEARDGGKFAVLVSCDVYNGTTEAVSGVVATLSALDGEGSTVLESTAQPSGFLLDARKRQRIEVRLTGLTEQQVERISFLRLATRHAK